jgi:hypothetical protein
MKEGFVAKKSHSMNRQKYPDNMVSTVILLKSFLTSYPQVVTLAVHNRESASAIPVPLCALF